jgi:hypothetical protein
MLIGGAQFRDRREPIIRQAPAVGPRRPILTTKSAQIASTRLTVASSTSRSGASAAMRSKTLRSPAMMVCARFRSVMSVMLARTSSPCPGKGISLTSVAIALPSAGR